MEIKEAAIKSEDKLQQVSDVWSLGRKDPNWAFSIVVKFVQFQRDRVNRRDNWCYSQKLYRVLICSTKWQTYQFHGRR